MSLLQLGDLIWDSIAFWMIATWQCFVAHHWLDVGQLQLRSFLALHCGSLLATIIPGIVLEGSPPLHVFICSLVTLIGGSVAF